MERAPTFLEIDISLSFKTTMRFFLRCPAWFSASKAIPPVSEPSPMTEMTRLASHLDQFRQLLVAKEPIGRKMDFLVQEMHREVNTIGSKSQSAEIAAAVVEMKAEVERMREQVQNVE